ncbi:MAG: hypothetical protein U5K74_15710 [Gemmatimonadaceae bacterium]|nr:hypothetical protein [Gemmatimonadaceae bacterium]
MEMARRQRENEARVAAISLRTECDRLFGSSLIAFFEALHAEVSPHHIWANFPLVVKLPPGGGGEFMPVALAYAGKTGSTKMLTLVWRVFSGFDRLHDAYANAERSRWSAQPGETGGGTLGRPDDPSWIPMEKSAAGLMLRTRALQQRDFLRDFLKELDSLAGSDGLLEASDG